jgi:hypothetical protein
MEQSIELRNLMLQFYESYSSGDNLFIENMFSQKEGVLVIGSDPNEWWAGYETIINIFKSQMGETGDFNIVDVDTKAYCEGTVGWGASQTIMKMTNGLEIPFRITAVFHQEDGDWKVLQWHASVGVSNEETLEQELTT